MSFNSITFLFWFLPIFLIAYYITRLRLRAVLLLCASLFVYSWGNTKSLAFLIGFIVLSYVMGLLVEYKKNTLPLAVVLDVALLALFKFTSAGSDYGIAGGIPLGLSFYTLSGISYVCDIAAGRSKACHNPVKLALYIAMFPKLMVGPVVQYADIEDQLDWPSVNSDMVASGVLRFSIGLYKKLVFAGALYEIRHYCWLDAGNSTASAWLAIIAYSLELYYDFSGYSDMAIGLAKMMGFTFKENFIYPYASPSLSDFWRRWHASLGAWFRTYVYIPMGGSRTGSTFRNMFVVWLLTALWHGTGTQFLCWGGLMFIACTLEKVIRSKIRFAHEKKVARAMEEDSAYAEEQRRIATEIEQRNAAEAAEAEARRTAEEAERSGAVPGTDQNNTSENIPKKKKKRKYKVRSGKDLSAMANANAIAKSEPRISRVALIQTNGPAELGRILGNIYTVIIVMAGWVFFNSASAFDAFTFFGNLAGYSKELTSAMSDSYFASSFPIMILAAIGATPIPKEAAGIVLGLDKTNVFTTILKCLFVLALLIASTVVLVESGYTPFIYSSF